VTFSRWSRTNEFLKLLCHWILNGVQASRPLLEGHLLRIHAKQLYGVEIIEGEFAPNSLLIPIPMAGFYIGVGIWLERNKTQPDYSTISIGRFTMGNVDLFIEAIETKKKVLLTFFSMDKGRAVSKICIPLDYGNNQSGFFPTMYYHCLDCEADLKMLRIQSKQIYAVELLKASFNPTDFIKQVPPEWMIARKWPSTTKIDKIYPQPF